MAELEAARALKTLIDSGRLPPPARTLRFIWPAEIEGSLIYLVDRGDVERVMANIHMDMVGGGAVTKSVFRISGGPVSLPSFVGDVAHEIGHFVNAQTLAHASGEAADFPLVSAEGTRNPQLAVMEALDLGSDHQVFNEGSFRIPGIYLHDWPDRYIHTNFDIAANIDPTKLKRAAFIAALQGYYLAAFGPEDVEPLTRLLKANALQRARGNSLQQPSLSPLDRAPVMAIHWAVEREKIASIEPFAPLPAAIKQAVLDAYAQLEQLTTPGLETAMAEIRDDRVFARNPEVRGPMWAFGYSYREAHFTPEELAAMALTGDQAYEALNLVDGQRSISEIRRWLVAEFGDLPLEAVSQYLEALERIEVVRRDGKP